MNVNIQVPALEKLIDYTASGYWQRNDDKQVRKISGTKLAPWKALDRQEVFRGLTVEYLPKREMLDHSMRSNSNRFVSDCSIWQMHARLGYW